MEEEDKLYWVVHVMLQVRGTIGCWYLTITPQTANGKGTALNGRQQGLLLYTAQKKMKVANPFTRSEIVRAAEIVEKNVMETHTILMRGNKFTNILNGKLTLFSGLLGQN